MKTQKSIKILVKTISKNVTVNGNSNFLDKVWLSVNLSVTKTLSLEFWSNI